jgi:SAM-dependent methyltransferase
MTNDELRTYFDRQASERLQWLPNSRYYREQLERACRFLIPPGASVLDLGCGIGSLLAALEPARGLGIDLSPEMVRVAQQRHPELEFRVGDAEQLAVDERFDFVVVSDLVSHLNDIQACFERLSGVTRPESRVVVTFHNFLWEPALKLAERIGLKMPQHELNWLGVDDVANLLRLAGFEVVRRVDRMLLPVAIPGLAPIFNGIVSQLPGLRRLCLINILVARPVAQPHEPELSVSVVVPTRNERGNIAGVIERTPHMGSRTEIVFVDGNSSDGTAEEIEQQIREHPNSALRLVHQGKGVGKGDAVRQGFDVASGDVLMILDADLTMPPEDLPKFFHALVSGHGDLINGSRLVYPMETQAMRLLNLFGNKLFALLFSWLLDQRLKDTLCGTKVLRRRDYLKIKAQRAFFGDFDPFGDFDLLFGAAKQNLKIVEVPIRYRERTYGTTNIRRFRHGWLLLQMCVFAYRKLKVV